MAMPFDNFTITFNIVPITTDRECTMFCTFQCCNFPSFNIIQYGSINAIIIFRAKIFWNVIENVMLCSRSNSRHLFEYSI